jgi:hypothetical protein
VGQNDEPDDPGQDEYQNFSSQPRDIPKRHLLRAQFLVLRIRNDDDATT